MFHHPWRNANQKRVPYRTAASLHVAKLAQFHNHGELPGNPVEAQAPQSVKNLSPNIPKAPGKAALEDDKP